MKLTTQHYVGVRLTKATVDYAYVHVYMRTVINAFTHLLSLVVFFYHLIRKFSDTLRLAKVFYE